MLEKSNPLIEKEKTIQKFWLDNQIFEKTLAATKNGELYSFYDGPPFATGTPHYGHLVASIMKDVVPRYQTMQGKYVERKWGWDCHGLPIENIVEKNLKLKSRKDIEQFGIDKFNKEARKNVLMYADEWKKTIPRLGRWVDMENDYKTMEPWYMESIWWAFKELWDKGLIYQGHKAMHICPRCETTLSNFEVTQGYKDVKDLSVTVKFELIDEPGTYVLAWTTTPWTLVGNVALAVGRNIKYVAIIQKDNKAETLILAKERLELIEGKYEIVRELTGESLVGLKYEPLFDYYQAADLPNKENLYTIVDADFVSTEDGTGVVHIAPAFGEVDMILGREKKLSFIQHVDMAGRFQPEVKDFAGLEVKPSEDPQKTDIEVIKYLAAKNLLFAKEKYEHSYPHCWRCDTPLLNYATSSWFVRVTKIKQDLIKNNQKIHWVPEHIKDGRFGKWLEDAKDWAVSRSRYWGTPLPVWQCDCGENKVVGSIKELEKLSGQKVEDLHKHIVDEIKFKCAKCGGEMKRIPEVLDCWFESGSMPYAQFHYPFENEAKFKKSFPADFIAEGPDQTRGWFYTLMVLATALFGKEAFKNVIVNGIVLAEDGKKMSKRLQNYPEPDVAMEKYGADALRYYLLSSPVMSAENLNFSESETKEAYQKVVMLLNNIVTFYKLYEDKNLPAKDDAKNILDRWIIAKLNLLIQEVTEAMDNYYLSKAVRPIAGFIDELSTWWLRRSRDRLKGDEKTEALKTFKYVLSELVKVMAPFTPFMAEYLYQAIGGEKESVHLESWPQVNKKLIDAELIKVMAQARKIVELGLAKRAEAGIKIRQPLKQLTIKSCQLSSELSRIVADEVNVENVVCEVGKELAVELDTELTAELKMEGVLRELIRTINGMRKKQGLTINDRIKIEWQSAGELTNLVFANANLIAELKKSVLADEIMAGDGEEVEINGEVVKLGVKK